MKANCDLASFREGLCRDSMTHGVTMSPRAALWALGLSGHGLGW